MNILVVTMIHTSAIAETATQSPHNPVARLLCGAMTGEMRRGRHAAALRLGCVAAAWPFLLLQTFDRVDYENTCISGRRGAALPPPPMGCKTFRRIFNKVV
ncbi:hypothetical protein Y032_0011g1453 [Ancylostoma ceylanicum]|uniref:Uncharacterized protein n=1 Tax=Ancylostoma ceylanicum TaxID=53326 RepID=A0A016VF38_9BILA|nr:hypothetical protein Y032_0011g1453 [Ancylostoma ceylanicum]